MEVVGSSPISSTLGISKMIRMKVIICKYLRKAAIRPKVLEINNIYNNDK